MPTERLSVRRGTLMNGRNKTAESKPAPPAIAAAGPDRISVELSSRRTGMSFQRTRMSADRTLMSVIRTALALIGFGFTIFQFFEKLREAGTLSGTHAARNFGLALVVLGIGMLVLGIVYHVQFMLGLRHLRHEMTTQGLIHGESHFPVSLTLIIAAILLLVGIAAIVSMVFNTGPFG
jgi:putative membrane protein